MGTSTTGLSITQHRTRLLRLAVSALALLLAVGAPARAQSCSADLDGDGIVNSSDLAALLANWGACPPSVTQVSPPTGSVLGGTLISITGGGLSEVTEVTIGGAPCTQVTVLSPNLVRAFTPPGAAGVVSIRVFAPSGSAFAPEPFTYVQQQVSSIVPNSGGYSGGTLITITGQFLADTTGVTVGGVPCTSVTVVSATQVTALTPAGSVGMVDVVVDGSKGSTTVAGGFTYQPIVVPSWATLLEGTPNPEVVTSAALRDAISSTGFAWRVRDTATQIEMVLIPPGTFSMGCSPSNQAGCAPNESPVRAVTLTNAFYLGRREVTQSQWLARMGSNPSHFQSASAQVPEAEVPNRPVETVSWSMIAGPEGFLSGTGMRLPTEAEWEYAYRAGTTTAFHGFAGNLAGTNNATLIGNLAWHSGNSPDQTRPVGGRAPNGFGLYDMSGNVMEWVNDWFSASYYATGPLVNPTGPATGVDRVLRGGSWFEYSSGWMRSSARNYASPFDLGSPAGFRVVRDPL